MIVETKARDIKRSASFEEKAMGLAVGSEAFVFNVLRKDLYSDPVGSLIREYTVNAQDEHRKYGKGDTPILIQVPNHFSPELHIRDYAGGLTEAQVFEFFGNYGASDKRGTNDAVGFFGLGCKSAFAYTDSYIVKSFKDGKVYTFNIYIDETEIGKTAKIAEEATDEPNGIEIIVPVKTHDINRFQQKVVSTVRYFKTKPTLKGMEVPSLEAKKSTIKGEGWEFFGSGSPTVIMGEIPYPIDYYKMGDNLESWESHLLQSEIVIYVGIGDVQVTASREALQFTPKTVQAIRAKLANIKDTMIAETEKAFAAVDNLIEAKQLWHKVVGSGGGYSNIIRNCTDGVKWKGEKLTDNIIKLDSNLHSVTTYMTNRRSDYIKTYVAHNIICNKDEKFYFDDTDGANVGYKRRARTLLQAGDSKVTIIHTLDQAALEKVIGMPVKKLLSFNAIVPTIAASNRQGGTGVDLSKKAKHVAKQFVLNIDKLRGYYSAASEVWEVKEVDTSVGGVFVNIERFKPVGGGRVYDLSSLNTAINDAKNAGIDIDVPIYGIKKGGDTTGLVEFEAWLSAKVKGNKELIKNYGIVRGYQNSHNLIDVSNVNLAKLADTSLLKQYTTLHKEVRALASNSDSKYRVFRYSTVQPEADNTLAKMSKEVGLKYPLLNYISSYHYSKPEVLEYILERDA